MSMHFKSEDEETYTSFNLKEKLITMLNKVKHVTFRIKDYYYLQIEKLKYHRCSTCGIKSRSVNLNIKTTKYICGECEINGI